MRRSDRHAPLLRQVGGRSHATSDHHTDEPEAAYMTPASTSDGAVLSSVQVKEKVEAEEMIEEEDWDRDPDSSDGSADESDVKTSGFKVPPISESMSVKVSPVPKFKKAPVAYNGSKRTSPEPDEDSDDAMIFGSQESSKRQRLQRQPDPSSGGRATFVNHLAPSSSASSQTKRPMIKKYSHTSPATSRKMSEQPKDKIDKKKKDETAPRFTKKSKSAPQKTVAAPTFQKLRQRSDGRPQRSMGGTAQEVASEPLEDEIDASLLEVDDRTDQDLLADRCPMCGELIDPVLRVEFEDEHSAQLRGRRLNFQWQKRFCLFHRQRDAELEWNDRDYPDIDWNGLEARMRQHRSFLLHVLNRDETKVDHRILSHHRNALAARLKPGTKGIQQTFNHTASGKPGAAAGYYGPRGEKVMSDFILSELADAIRTRAAHDSLVAASGAQGGVSGFVQAVLVPHLAEMLIREDLKLGWPPKQEALEIIVIDLDASQKSNGAERQDEEYWTQKARAEIARSIELGEIMHPETEDQVLESEDEDDL